MAYATNLQPHFQKDHHEHKKCTEDHCTTHNIDTSQYATQHTLPTCHCSFQSPPLSHISQILSSNEIPVVVYHGDTLAVRSAASGPYVAISHVWIDGMGSTTETGLPTCHISHIANFARQFVEDGAFWVDSLCVPEDKSLRKQAILLMAKTYQHAEAVVVFDKSIHKLCSSSSPVESNFLRVLSSGWMQRVWTLQEALLAKKLYFEFSDGLFPGDQLLGDEASSSLFERINPLTAYLPASSLRYILKPPKEVDSLYNTSKVIGMLQYRTTSKPEDETLAIAGLLNIDISKLLAESDPESRVQTLLLELRTLPTNILFA
ncbi:hypothetical protein L218DRAFT_867422, partial [Marasmius fiardii PR-910]